MPEAGQIALGNRPSTFNWIWANAAARTGQSVTDADRGKFGYQVDTGKIYAHTVAGWMPVNATLIAEIEGLQDALDDKVNADLLGAANGVATLGSDSKLTAAQLPASVVGALNYQGTYNATTNSPTLADPPDASTKGYYYKVATAGTQFGLTFAVGDFIVSNGAGWDKVDNTDPTASALLDTLSSTQGAVLFRGAAGWGALGPTTSGYVLKTKGAGADPAFEALDVASITIREIDGSPSIAATVLEIPNSYLADQGGGVARLSFPSVAGGDFPTLVPPSAISNWNKLNQSTASMGDSGVGQYILETGRSNFNFRMILIPYPGTPFTVSAMFRVSHNAAARVCCGLTMAEALANQKFRHFSTDTSALNMWTWGSYTGYNAHNYQYATIQRGMIWMRLVDDGTNIQAYVSENGQVWAKFGAAIARTNYFTPTYLGWHLDGGGDSNCEAAGQLLHWVVS